MPDEALAAQVSLLTLADEALGAQVNRRSVQEAL